MRKKKLLFAGIGIVILIAGAIILYRFMLTHTGNLATGGIDRKEGDICAEHGVPENECTRCDPSLIQKFKNKGDWCGEHNVPESQCATCNPELPSPRKDNSEITISVENKTIAGIKTEKVKSELFKKEISATGKVTFNENRLVHITSNFAGRIEKVFAFSQSKVKKGKPLVSIYSPEYMTIQSEYIQAEERLARTIQMGDKDEEKMAKSIYQSVRQKLLIIGASEDEIAKLGETHNVQPYLVVRAKFAGTIIESNVIQGNYIQVGSNLFKLADLTKVWIIADVYETDIGHISSGQIVEIKALAYPDKTFKGKVETIGDVLDEKLRTFKVRIAAENPEGYLKPEMYVNITVSHSNNIRLIIPKKAVLLDGQDKMVFVSANDKSFVARKVRVGMESRETVQVINGLNDGESVVTEGNFLLKSELLKSKIGDGCAD